MHPRHAPRCSRWRQRNNPGRLRGAIQRKIPVQPRKRGSAELSTDVAGHHGAGPMTPSVHGSAKSPTVSPGSARSRCWKRQRWGGRMTMDWIASILSADQEIKGNMRLLRARARELSRNNPVAKSTTSSCSSQTSSARMGIGYQAQVRNSNGDLNAAFNTKIEDRVGRLGKEVGNCTPSIGKLSFRAVQNLDAPQHRDRRRGVRPHGTWLREHSSLRAAANRRRSG